jgi:hypothetical protein
MSNRRKISLPKLRRVLARDMIRDLTSPQTVAPRTVDTWAAPDGPPIDVRDDGGEPHLETPDGP